MKTITIILLTLCALTASAQTYIVRPPPSTVRNGGFETDPDANGQHWPWSLFAPDNGTYPDNPVRAFDTTASHSGAHAQGFYRGLGRAMFGVEPLTPFRYYSVSFWAKKIPSALNPSPDTVMLRVAVGDQGDIAAGVPADDTTLTQTGTYAKYGPYTITGMKMAVCDTTWKNFSYPIIQCSDYVQPVSAFQFILRSDNKGVIIDDVTVQEVVPHTYYVSASGNDSASGVTQTMAWRTLNKLARRTFAPGDTILFKRGDTFYQGEISKSGAGFAGTIDSGIVIGAYGSGPKPILYGDFTGATWTQVTGYSGVTGVWKTFAGTCFGSDGWERVNGTWQTMTQSAGEIRFYLNNQDSVKKYLQSLTASSYGPGTATNNATDTIYVKTHDGNSPADSIHIFRSNQINGQYMTVRDIEFRNWKSAVNTYPAHNSIFRNLTIRNNRYIAIFLANKSSYNLVDSCTVDSAGYDAFYSYGGRRNIFRYDTVRVVNRLVLGTSNAVELAGIGCQEDTACVIERSAFYDCEFDGLAGYFNDQDTVRYCTFTGQSGVWLHGSCWVAHNNTVTTTGATYPAITATLSGAGETKAYSNMLTSAGDGQAFQLRVGAEGTLVYTGNTVILTGATSTRFDDFQYTTGVTSTNNSFFGTGKFNAGLWPSEVVYNSLAEFQTAGYESGSTWGETYTPPEEPIVTRTGKLLLTRKWR